VINLAAFFRLFVIFRAVNKKASVLCVVTGEWCVCRRLLGKMLRFVKLNLKAGILYGEMRSMGDAGIDRF
jgi:hypothetical protein